ncbi:adenylylsulfate kinase [Atractiella rhizophila]|nr:adenylylsulfate kinase [Atractiella rhizophila]
MSALNPLQPTAFNIPTLDPTTTPSSKAEGGVKATNITWHEGMVDFDERKKNLGQGGATIWFTGLSASGKSTLSCALEQHLLHQGIRAFRLDGDNVRHGLNKDLGFSEADRTENIRRIGEVSLLLSSSCCITLTAFISPYKADRALARSVHSKAGIDFIEVFADASLESVEKRDPKGLYAKARKGEIKDFTGISAPYEAPTDPEVHIKTDEVSVEEGVEILVKYLKEKGILN